MSLSFNERRDNLYFPVEISSDGAFNVAGMISLFSNNLKIY